MKNKNSNPTPPKKHQPILRNQMEVFLFFLAIPAATFLVIFLAPTNALDQWVWAKLLCGNIFHLLPAAERNPIHSTFPQIRQLGACLTIATIPIQLSVHLFLFTARAQDTLSVIKSHQALGYWLKNFIIAFAGLIFSLIGFFHEPQSPLSRTERLMETQRFSAAFTDAGLTAFIPISLALLVFSTIGIFQNLAYRRHES